MAPATVVRSPLAAAVILVTKSVRHILTEGGVLQNPISSSRFVESRSYLANPLMELYVQCRNEHWTDKLHEQADEGCNVSGRIRVNKVVGSIHFSPGRSFQANTRNLYELVPYLKEDANRHDFSHTVHQWQFECRSFHSKRYSFLNALSGRRI